MNITLQLQIWDEEKLEKLIHTDRFCCFIPLTFLVSLTLTQLFKKKTSIFPPKIGTASH